MSVESFQEIPIAQFGGLCTLMAASDVPAGMSPDCQDVEFIPGGVRTRPGLILAFTAVTSNPSFTGLKSYVPVTGTQYLLALTDDGRLLKGEPDGALSTIHSALRSGAYLHSQTAYGNEYLALSDGIGGIDLPLLYDNAQFERVSQCGPGAGPTPSAEGITQKAIATISRAANVVTVTTTTAHGFSANYRVTISEVADVVGPPAVLGATFTGSFTILSAPTTTTFTYSQLGLDAASTGGFAAGSLAYLIAPSASQLLSVSALCRPWDCSGTKNAAYTFGNNTGLLPIIIPCDGAITVAYQSGTARPRSDWPWLDANGGPEPTGDGLGPATGNYFPTHYMAGSALGVVGLCGCFADASGNVIQAISIGAEAQTFAVPAGATRLQLGVNDDKFDDNAGLFSVKTNAGSGLMRINGYVTCQLAAGQTHGFDVGSMVAVVGCDDPSFEGSFILTSVPDTGSMIWKQIGPDAVSGNGSVEEASSVKIVGGERKVAVFFVTRTGYWTKLSPPMTFTSYTGHQIVLAGIPVGPSNIVARGVAITTADGASYYHLKKQMWLDDNSTTTLTMDFSEEELTGSLPVDYLLNLEILANAAAVTYYDQRLFWLGEENALPGFNNLGFDGGFATGLPLGWTATAGDDGAGGTEESTDVVWASAYKITGATDKTTRGKISQAVYQDAWAEVELLEKNTAYQVRARVKRSSGLVAGRLNIAFTGTGISDAGLQLTQVTEAWTEYEATILTAMAKIPTDIRLNVFADQSPTNAQSFYVDEIRILPAIEKLKTSYVRASRVRDPESYDGVKGFLMVEENNGQSVRAMFRLRNYLYLAKERSLFVTQDSGEEPFQWAIEELSATVGTPWLHGIGLGDGFAAIADRKGAYLFRGAAISEEDRISAEIQPTWERINWNGLGWVKVDNRRKRILFGVPLDSATKPSHILVLDYTDGFSDARGNNGVGRAWTIWNLGAGCCELVQGVSRLFYGANDDSGRILEQVAGRRSDDGAAIRSYYDTAYLGGKGGRKLFGYFAGYVEGAGELIFSSRLVSAQTVRRMLNRPLSFPASRDMELPLNISAERVSFRFEANEIDHWFDTCKLRFYVKPDPWTPVRGK